jgi:hypothetical protein
MEKVGSLTMVRKPKTENRALRRAGVTREASIEMMQEAGL